MTLTGQNSTSSLVSSQDFFLGVARSATDRAWRDRLDDRGRALAAAIMQRHELPDLLARIIAGRGIDLDGIEDFLDPRRSRYLVTMTSMAQRRARYWRDICASAASIR
jgi:single-stranded-DNA-specific exonuclease